MSFIKSRAANFKSAISSSLEDSPEISNNVVPFPGGHITPAERQALDWIKVFQSLPADLKQRTMWQRGRLAGRSACEALGRGPRLTSLGAAAASFDLARKVTEALKGDWHGSYGTAPGPNHSKRDRSLQIKPHESDPKDVFLLSYAGDDWQSIKDDLRARGVLPARPAGVDVTLEDYAAAKRLPEAFLRELGLKTVPNPWHTNGHEVQKILAIPYRDADGKLIRTRYRIAMTGDKKHIWDEQKGKRLALYGLDRLGKAERLYLVEGESDTQTLWHRGYASLGIPGATNYNPSRDDPTLAGYYGDIVAIIEPDKGGKAMLAQLAKSQHAPRIRAARLPGFKDVSDLHCRAPERFNEVLLAAVEQAVPLSEAIEQEWPEPQPIDAPLYPVPAFDPQALLPDGLRYFVMDAAYRMPCAPEYVATSVIASAGSVIGTHCAIRPKRCDPWLVVPNLWGANVGDPSQLKSPALEAGLKPFNRLIAIAAKEYKEALVEAKFDNVVSGAKRKAIEDKIKIAAKAADNDGLKQLREESKAHDEAESQPILRRYHTNDPSVEKIGELLRDNPAGVLFWRDELVGLIASWDRAGREGDRQFFLEAWSGTGSFATDRIGRGTILIPKLCVAIFGGMQPDKLTAYLEQASDALANDGLLQRFQLLVYPDPILWEYRDRLPDKRARERVDHIFEKLANFDPVEWGASQDPFLKFPYFYFNDPAQDFYIEWVTGLHKRIEAEDNALIRQHLGKYDKLFPALALIFHMVDQAAGGSQNEITKACVSRAAAWCEFLETHARRCYGLLADEGLKSAQALAKKFKEPLPENFNPEDFTARDVYVKGWRYLTRVEDAETALDWLERKGWVSRREGKPGPLGGRPTDRYTLNPRIRKEPR